LPTKKEYERVLNEVLQLNIKWSRLTKEELASFATLLNSPVELLNRLGVKTEKGRLRERTLRLIDTLGLEGPFIKMLRELLKE